MRKKNKVPPGVPARLPGGTPPVLKSVPASAAPAAPKLDVTVLIAIKDSVVSFPTFAGPNQPVTFGMLREILEKAMNRVNDTQQQQVVAAPPAPPVPAAAP